MVKRLLIGTTLLVALCLPSRIARADQADDLFQEGREAFRAKRFDEAEAKYETAFALRKSPDIASNLAQAELQLGKKREAAEHLAYAIRIMPATTKPEVRDAMLKTLGELRQELGELRIETTVPGAEIKVGDRVIGTAPLDDTVMVEPMAYVITATLSAHEPAEQRVVAEKGKSITVRLVLTPKKGEGPLRTEPKPLWPPLLLGGLAAAGVAVGIAGVVVGVSKDSEADDLAASATCNPVTAQCLALGDSFASDRSAFMTMGVIGFSAGGAALAGMIIYLLVPQVGPASQQTALQITPSVSPASAAATLTLRF